MLVIDEELVCYLFFYEHMSVSQIARHTKASEKHIRNKIVYCWSNDTIAANAFRYKRKHKKVWSAE